jgi:hypothetical protein
MGDVMSALRGRGGPVEFVDAGAPPINGGSQFVVHGLSLIWSGRAPPLMFVLRGPSSPLKNCSGMRSAARQLGYASFI